MRTSPNGLFTCRICASVGPALLPLATDEMFRCGRCGTVQVIELPSHARLQEFYQRYNEQYTAGMGERFAREMTLRYEAKFELMKRLGAGNGRLLDVGCGEGMFLRMASERGYEAVGCDYSVRSSYPPGVRVVAGVLDQAGGLPFPDASFDVVTIWAVIEHVRDPRQALLEIRRVLRPGGLLFCDTPLCGQASEQYAAARSHWFCPPEHLHVFSAAGLRTLHEAAGLKTLAHFPSFERNHLRAVARWGRNLLVGVLWGGLLRAVDYDRWHHMRRERDTQIGDIQLLVSKVVA